MEENINENRNRKKYIKKIILIIILIICIISGILYYKINNRVIFINSYENYAWGSYSNGYKIYANGTIKEYDNYNDDGDELKKAKISDEELVQLKKLADSVESNYINNFNPESILNPDSFDAKFDSMWDAGVTEKKIYNSGKKEWIILYQFGDTMGYNNNEETKEIIELTEMLYEKYLGDDE